MFLMTYVTPVFDHIHALAGILAEHGFSGAIIPDLPFETLEAQALLHDFHACGLMLVPVVAPTMEPRRLSLFSRTLPPKNLIYAAARTGQTGEKSRIDSRDARAYLDELRRVFPRNPICVGFGIREKSQADFLRERGFIPVIGSAIVETIASSEESGDAGERMQEFFMRM
jgi:tryptophan synthase alpha chain